MFRKSAREFALLARIIEHSKRASQLQTQRSKTNSKAEKMKALMYQEKMLYGKLVETKKEKLKRAKKGNEGKIPEVEPSDSSSHPELAWMLKMQNSGVLTGLKKITPPKPKPTVPWEDQSVSTNLEVSRDKQSVQTTDHAKRESSLKEDSVNKHVAKEKPIESKKNSLLSLTVIQKLLEFPIVETYKSPDDKWSSDFKIMSLSAMEERSCLKYPSVTRILSATMTEEAKAVLERWKMGMIEKLGESGFELYQAELLSDGKMLHSSIMNRLTDKPYEVPERVKNAFKSLDKVLENVEGVRAIESHVIHPTLLYRGIVDCVAVYRGNLCCIDWKKSDKAKNTLGSTYDAPLQLASYIGALNADLKYPFQIKKGLIIVAYTNGDPATVHEVSEESLQLYWRLWLQRLQEYHIALNT
ncbi:mitochondrial genome maintenance exonuclease 1 [Nasonia vitripennis]|uniref:Mitochondrial genome maintenance exonuclease 1 n=1 Tax=Nasonia vitripennis TaxID=7425 RepID=A0A7M7GBJ5_NASVI|nr:mitochondrial genome maintenance exonuclease 1 [Nasonia vitripennis]